VWATVVHGIDLVVVIKESNGVALELNSEIATLANLC
jgi:hypothetical protein